MSDEDNKTLWCGNLPEQVTEEILYELFLQAGPLKKVRIPRDRDGRQKNFAFVTYCHEISVPYAMKLFYGTALFHRTLSLQCRGRMAILPPPIRSISTDSTSDFLAQINIANQFAEMTEKLKEEDHKAVQKARHWQDLNEKLFTDVLQGNWSYRHHPYRPKENHLKDSYRNRENHSNHRGNSYGKHSNNWRERRGNHKKSNNYHRRD